MNALHRLQDWYLSQCDGDWEHAYTVRITTLDNPGWALTVDTKDTSLEGQEFERLRVDRSDDDWIHYWATKERFEAACGPRNLEEALTLFLRFAEGERPPGVG